MGYRSTVCSFLIAHNNSVPSVKLIVFLSYGGERVNVDSHVGKDSSHIF